MDAIRRAHFKTVLVRDRDRIVTVSARITATAASRAAKSVAARLAADLAEIERALAILAASPECYGVCARCGRPIPERRLEIVPATRDCDRHGISEAQLAPELGRRPRSAGTAKDL